MVDVTGRCTSVGFAVEGDDLCNDRYGRPRTVLIDGRCGRFRHFNVLVDVDCPGAFLVPCGGVAGGFGRSNARTGKVWPDIVEVGGERKQFETNDFCSYR